MAILLAELFILFTINRTLIIFTERREIRRIKSAADRIIQFLGSAMTECLVIPSDDIVDKLIGNKYFPIVRMLPDVGY